MGLLLLIFSIIVLLGAVGIAILYLSKKQEYKTAAFYFLCSLSVIITFINYTSLPSNYETQQLLSLAVGSIGILAFITKLLVPKKPKVSYVIVTISTLLGMINLVIS